MNDGGFKHGNKLYRWDARPGVLRVASFHPAGYDGPEIQADVASLCEIGVDARMVAEGAKIPADVIDRCQLPGESPAWQWHEYESRGQTCKARYDVASGSIVVLVHQPEEWHGPYVALGEWLGPYYHEFPHGTFGDSTKRRWTRRCLGDGADEILIALGVPSEAEMIAVEMAQYNATLASETARDEALESIIRKHAMP